ncbi:hypothetical protein DFQ27_007180 [Actinomortierella ambigua]|uniref:Peptidase C15, pyroglutamyl peptidase I-like protein n=1 Tax=Actinomortierella ambigua TaxID=1343610 RepID=A0A9P6PVM2_9FUNG|nr:hypothetical protein DFQ27_007180 [Actinomortierella ambigua]
MAPVIKRNTSKVKVVLTGFEPFRQHATNPSWLSVRPLHNTVLDLPKSVLASGEEGPRTAEIVCHELPVEYRKVPDLVPRLHETYDPSAAADGVERVKTYFIHLGVGLDGSTAIETHADRVGYSHADNAQWCPPSLTEPPVCKAEWANDPAKLVTTVDTAALAKYLEEEKGWKCRQSLDAGHYLCEYTFYLSMAERNRRIQLGQEDGSDRVCLFVHLPSVGNPYTLDELTRFVQDMVTRVVTAY